MLFALTRSQVFETLCLILLVTTGGSGVSTTMLAMGPGALVLLSRAFLTHGSWARLLAAFRTPRYLCHIAYKVAATAGWALDRPELLWGLPEAVYDGMLLPLCCPVRLSCLLKASRKGLSNGYGGGVYRYGGMLLPYFSPVSAQRCGCGVAIAYRYRRRVLVKGETGSPVSAYLVPTAGPLVVAARVCEEPYGGGGALRL